MAHRNKASEFFGNVFDISIYALLFSLPFSKSLVEISFVVAFLSWLARHLLISRFNVKEYLPKSSVYPFLALYLGTWIVGALFSSYRLISIGAFFTKTLENVFIFLFLYEAVRERGRLKPVMYVLTASFFLIAADAAFQYFTGSDFLRGYGFYSETNKRLRASFSGAIGFAGWLTAVSPVIAAYLLASERKVSRVAGWAVVSLFLLLLASTSSRAAVSSVVLSVLIFFAIATEKKFFSLKRLAIFLVIFLLVSGAALYHAFNYPVKRGIGDILSGEDISTRNRIELWRQGMAMAGERPLLGWGQNTYARIADDFATYPKGYYYPHNSFLHILIEMGIIGLMGFLAFVFKWYTLFVGALRRYDGIILAGLGVSVSAFLLQAFFDTHLYSLNLAAVFYALLGLGLALIDVQNARSMI